jgi:hypothetical protein
MATPSSRSETANNGRTSSQGDGAVEAMEKQIAQLRREIGKINRTLAEQAEAAGDEVGGWYASAADRASRAVSTLGNQARGVTGAVRENPGTVSTALLLGGVLGLIAGLLINQQDLGDRRWFDRW